MSQQNKTSPYPQKGHVSWKQVGNKWEVGCWQWGRSACFRWLRAQIFNKFVPINMQFTGCHSSRVISRSPAETRRWINGSLTLVHRLRRWASGKPTLIQRLFCMLGSSLNYHNWWSWYDDRDHIHKSADSHIWWDSSGLLNYMWCA